MTKSGFNPTMPANTDRTRADARASSGLPSRVSRQPTHRRRGLRDCRAIRGDCWKVIKGPYPRPRPRGTIGPDD